MDDEDMETESDEEDKNVHAYPDLSKVRFPIKNKDVQKGVPWSLLVTQRQVREFVASFRHVFDQWVDIGKIQREIENPINLLIKRFNKIIKEKKREDYFPERTNLSFLQAFSVIFDGFMQMVCKTNKENLEKFTSGKSQREPIYFTPFDDDQRKRFIRDMHNYTISRLPLQ
jgi:hypothetical protein